MTVRAAVLSILPRAPVMPSRRTRMIASRSSSVGWCSAFPGGISRSVS